MPMLGAIFSAVHRNAEVKPKGRLSPRPFGFGPLLKTALQACPGSTKATVRIVSRKTQLGCRIHYMHARSDASCLGSIDDRGHKACAQGTHP